MGELLVIEREPFHARGDEFVLRGAIHQARQGLFRSAILQVNLPKQLSNFTLPHECFSFAYRRLFLKENGVLSCLVRHNLSPFLAPTFSGNLTAIQARYPTDSMRNALDMLQ